MTLQNGNGGTSTLKEIIPNLELKTGELITTSNYWVTTTCPLDILPGQPWQCQNLVSTNEKIPWDHNNWSSSCLRNLLLSGFPTRTQNTWPCTPSGCRSSSGLKKDCQPDWTDHWLQPDFCFSCVKLRKQKSSWPSKRAACTHQTMGEHDQWMNGTHGSPPVSHSCSLCTWGVDGSWCQWSPWLLKIKVLTARRTGMHVTHIVSAVRACLTTCQGC